MSTQIITLNLPEPLYQNLKIRADQAKRSVEEETLEVLATAMPENAALPGDLQQALASLNVLDDSALVQTARGRLDAGVSEEMEALNHKKQREGLNEMETENLADLVRQYERNMLVRAQAAVLLKRRR